MYMPQNDVVKFNGHDWTAFVPAYNVDQCYILRGNFCLCHYKLQYRSTLYGNKSSPIMHNNLFDKTLEVLDCDCKDHDLSLNSSFTY